MRTEFSSLLKHKESPYKTRFEFTDDDDYLELYNEADNCDGLLSNAISEIATLLSISTEGEENLPSYEIVSNVAFAISNINSLRLVFRDIARQSKALMDQKEVSK